MTKLALTVALVKNESESKTVKGGGPIREQSGNVTFKWENKIRSESRENTFKQKQHEESKEWMTNKIKQEKIQNA